jgi:hypothetical protein
MSLTGRIGKATEFRSNTLVFGVMLLLLAPATSVALTKEQLLSMHRSGMSGQVLINTIVSDRPDFDLTPETLVQLKTAGLSDEVLAALQRSRARLHAGPADDGAAATPLDQAKRRYADGHFADSTAIARRLVDSTPDNFAARVVLIASLLRSNDRDGARRALAEARAHATTPSDVAALQGVMALAERLERLQPQKETLRAALARQNARAALAAIDVLEISDEQKSLLRVWIDLYRGDPDAALAKIGRITSSTERAKLEEAVAASRARLAEFARQRDFFLYDGMAISDFGVTARQQFPAAADTHSFDNYFKFVDTASASWPLHPEVMDLRLHAALYRLQEEEVLSLGDRILDAKGRLTIPFAAKDHYFNFTVDRVSRVLFTEQLSRPFDVKYRYKEGMFTTSYAEHERTNDNLGTHRPFKLKFEDISTLSQGGQLQRIELCGWGYKVLNFGSNRVATYPLMLQQFGGQMGELAHEAVMHNLGSLVAHVINRPQMNVALRKPRGVPGWLGAMVGVTAVANARSGDAMAGARAAAVNNALRDVDASGKFSVQQFELWSKSSEAFVEALVVIDRAVLAEVDAVLR